MSLPTLLTEMALARSLTWAQAAELLDAYEGDLARPDTLSDPLELSPRRPTATERDLAFVLMVRDLCKDFAPLSPEDRASRDIWVKAWDGATPEEAFAFDLRVTGIALGTCVNPGDGSSVPGLPLTQLMGELEMLATWPKPTKWTARRSEQVAAEVMARRGSYVPEVTWVDLASWWTSIETAAGERAERWRREAPGTYKDWSPRRELLGCAGEVTFALHHGLEPRLARTFDGGRDFGEVDVKTVQVGRPEVLKLPLVHAHKTTPRYALVVVDLEQRRGRYLGSASRERLLAAPVTKGPRADYHGLAAAELDE